jgi:hypothetical protein
VFGQWHGDRQFRRIIVRSQPWGEFGFRDHLAAGAGSLGWVSPLGLEPSLGRAMTARTISAWTLALLSMVMWVIFGSDATSMFESLP